MMESLAVLNQAFIAELYIVYLYSFRSSHQRCSIEVGVLKNFTKFTGKHLRQSLFLNKFAGLRPTTLLKKRPLAQVFSCEFCETCRTPPDDCFCSFLILFYKFR